MMEDIIKEGMVINFPDGEGTIINIEMKDNDYYVNVAFNYNESYKKTKFKIYQVVDKGDKVDFVLVTDSELAEDLFAKWLAQEIVDVSEENE